MVSFMSLDGHDFIVERWDLSIVPMKLAIDRVYSEEQGRHIEIKESVVSRYRKSSLKRACEVCNA
jgi:hypothetical protein